MSRHPHDIVPVNNQEDILLAIYDELVVIREALAPPAPAEAPSAAPAAETTEPAPAAAPRRTPKKKTTARKKTTK